MWYWYLLGYVVTGCIAIFGSAAWFIVATPVRNGYDMNHWLDHVNEVFDEVLGYQSRIDNACGVIITMFTWPAKLIWIAREVCPTIIERYEDLLNL